MSSSPGAWGLEVWDVAFLWVEVLGLWVLGRVSGRPSGLPACKGGGSMRG